MGSYNDKSKYANKPVNCGQPFCEVISVEECKNIVGGFELSDEKILELRNYVIAIANGAMNIYLEDFR